MTISHSDIRNAKILIVDDQFANVELLKYMLSGSGYTSVTTTMDARTVAELYRINRYDIVVLDLNMPYMNGFEVMEALQKIETEDYIPILVVTAQPEHKLHALNAGAKDFISKPFDHIEVLTRIHNMLEVSLLHKQLKQNNVELEERVRQRTADLWDSYHESIITLTSAAEHRDKDTGLHVERIGFYCRGLAERLDMDRTFSDEIFYSSSLHDVGKIAIPDHILLKPGGFTPEEDAIMKTHAALGADILVGKKSPYLKMGAEIALSHHERWDGSGYPRGLRGTAISVEARIMTICDVYDALRSKRPYKPALDHERTVEIMTRGDGRTEPDHFDPDMLKVFVQQQEFFREIYRDNADPHPSPA
ncbi:MAG: HD domain-containing phosphohydrolase [Pseudomonadota bacterium]